MRKDISRFGYIMELLRLSGASLADYLFVDRSLISKWKNGSRCINKDSDHYNKITEYILRETTQDQRNRLHKFFCKVYPDNPEHPEYLKRCLHTFFSKQPLPNYVYYYQNKHKDNSYEANISIYNGLSGKKAAMAFLVDILESNEMPTDIYLLDSECFNWYAEDDDGAIEKLFDLLGRLLDKGNIIHIFYCFLTSNMSSYSFFAKHFKLIFHENLKVHYNLSTYNFNYTYVIVKNKMSLVSHNFTNNPDEIYTAIYYDANSQRQYLAFADQLINNAYPIFKLVDSNERRRLMNILEVPTFGNETNYFGNFVPTFGTMQRGLLEEILNDNDVAGKYRTRCMSIYNTLRANLLNSQTKHLLSIEELENRMNQPKIMYSSLSALLGKEITLTKKQFLQHLNDTDEFLGQNKNFQIGLLKSNKQDGGASSICIWCKQNTWAFISDDSDKDKLVFLKSNIFIHMLTQKLEDMWMHIVDEDKSTKFISGKLKRFIKEQRVHLGNEE